MVATWLSVTLLLVAANAREVAAPSTAITLAVDATAAARRCPSAATIEALVEERVGADVVRPDARRFVQVRLAGASPRGVRATLEIIDEDRGPRGRREIGPFPADCVALADALVLQISLLASPLFVPSQGSSGGDLFGPPPSPETEAPGASPAPQPVPVVPSTRVVPQAGEQLGSTAQPAVDVSPWLALGGGAGRLPSLEPWLVLGARARLSMLRAALAAFISPPLTERSFGTITLRGALAGGRASVGAGTELPAPAWLHGELDGGALVEAGALWASGSPFPVGGVVGPWVGAGLGAGLELGLASVSSDGEPLPWRIRVDGSLLAPIVSARFANAAGTQVWSTGPVVGAVLIGAVWDFGATPPRRPTPALAREIR